MPIEDSFPLETQSPGECCENGVPLPDPFLDYITCPNCGEMEVELWCYEASVNCPICGEIIAHQQPTCFGTAYCDAILHKIGNLAKNK